MAGAIFSSQTSFRQSGSLEGNKKVYIGESAAQYKHMDSFADLRVLLIVELKNVNAA